MQKHTHRLCFVFYILVLGNPGHFSSLDWDGTRLLVSITWSQLPLICMGLGVALGVNEVEELAVCVLVLSRIFTACKNLRLVVTEVCMHMLESLVLWVSSERPPKGINDYIQGEYAWTGFFYFTNLRFSFLPLIYYCLLLLLLCLHLIYCCYITIIFT